MIKKIFKISLFMSLVISFGQAEDTLEELFKKLRVLEEKLECKNQFNAQKIQPKDPNVYIECIDNIFQFSVKNISQKEKKIKVIQIFLTSNKDKAEAIVKRYNLDVKKASSLNKSEAKFIERDILDTTVLKNGKYYKVIIFQKNININTLLTNLHSFFRKNYQDAFIIELLITEFQK